MFMIAGILLLCIVIVIHELGHLIAARRAGIRVLAFSVGFGPILWRKSWGGTEYRFSLVPVGGYILPDDGKTEVPKGTPPESLRGCQVAEATYGGRMLMLSAGILANLITGVVFGLTLIMMGGHSLPEALVIFGEKTVLFTAFTVDIFGQIFAGNAPPGAISGPIGIFKMGEFFASLGLKGVLVFLTAISINVGIMQLLPIPMMDGGQMLTLTIEKIRGQKISEKIENRLAFGSLVALLALMGYGLFNDITKPLDWNTVREKQSRKQEISQSPSTAPVLK